jgi:hypothetical protein
LPPVCFPCFMPHFIFLVWVSIVLGNGLCLNRFIKFSSRQPGVAARNRHLHTDSKNDSTGHLRRQSNRAPACVLATSTTLAFDSSYSGFKVSRRFDSGSFLNTQVDLTLSLCPALNANNMETLQQFTLVSARSESDSFRLFFRHYYPQLFENADLCVPMLNTILSSVLPLSQVRGFLAGMQASRRSWRSASMQKRREYLDAGWNRGRLRCRDCNSPPGRSRYI